MTGATSGRFLRHRVAVTLGSVIMASPRAGLRYLL